MAGEPDDLRIRLATADDVQAIHRALLGIAEAIGAVGKIRSTPEDLRRFGFGDKPAFEALIAEVSGTCAGVCVFFPSFSTWRGEPGVYVQDLYVAPGFRGHGVGARLMRCLAALTRSRGGGYVRLSVDASNADAQGFYTRLGLAHSEAERVHAAYDASFTALADAGEAEFGQAVLWS